MEACWERLRLTFKVMLLISFYSRVLMMAVSVIIVNSLRNRFNQLCNKPVAIYRFAGKLCVVNSLTFNRVLRNCFFSFYTGCCCSCIRCKVYLINFFWLFYLQSLCDMCSWNVRPLSRKNCLKIYLNYKQCSKLNVPSLVAKGLAALLVVSMEFLLHTLTFV